MTVNCSIFICERRTLFSPTGSPGNPNGSGQSYRGGILGFPFLFFLWHFAWFLNFTLGSLKPCLLFLLPWNTYHESCHYFAEKKNYRAPVCLLQLLWWDSSNFTLFCKLTTVLSKAPSLCAVPGPGDSPQPCPSLKTVSHIASSAKPLENFHFCIHHIAL